MKIEAESEDSSAQPRDLALLASMGFFIIISGFLETRAGCLASRLA
jgi:hypothetical protein